MDYYEEDALSLVGSCLWCFIVIYVDMYVKSFSMIIKSRCRSWCRWLCVGCLLVVCSLIVKRSGLMCVAAVISSCW